MRKILTLFLGVFFLLIISETFLRSIYYFHDRISSSKKDEDISKHTLDDHKKIFKILFLGNSHTYGIGVNRSDSYPGVLQRFFDKNLNGTSFKAIVFNEGSVNANTFDIRKRLERLYEKTTPDLALIMTGEPNIWKKNGYHEFAIAKNKESSVFYNFLVKLGENVKTIRWILSFNLLTNNNSNETTQNEDEFVLKQISNLDEYILRTGQNNDSKEQRKAYLESYFNRYRKNPPTETWRSFLFLLASLYYEYSEFSKTFEIVKLSIDFDKNTFDIFSYLLLDKMLNDSLIQGEDFATLLSLMNRLQSNPAFPGKSKVNQIIKHARFVISHEERALIKDFGIFLETHKHFKMLVGPAQDASLYQLSILGDHSGAAKTMLELFLANPLSSRIDFSTNLNSFLKNEKVDFNTRQLIQKSMDNFLNKYPHLSSFFTINNENKNQLLYEWIKYDLIQIIQISKKLNIPLIAHNYHWLRDRPIEESLVNNAIENATKEQRALFYDLHTDFMDIICGSLELRLQDSLG